MGSFDVGSLFTKICLDESIEPVKLAISYIFLKENQWAARLRTTWVVKLFYFSYAFRVTSAHFFREFNNTIKFTCIYT